MASADASRATPLIQHEPVMNSPSEPQAGEVVSAVSAIAHRVPAGSARPAAQRKCTGCEDEEKKPRQAKSAPSPQAASADPQRETSPVLDVIGKSGGQPLPPEVQADMEGRFAADFSDVRIHTDAKAAASALAVSARAYTVGNEVVFGRGSFAPHTPEGKRTLAHELAHVQQQRMGTVSGTDTGNGVKVSDPSDSFEQEAEATASRVSSCPPPAADNGAITDAETAGPSALRTLQQTDSVQLDVSPFTVERQCDPSVESCEPNPNAGTNQLPTTDAGASQPVTDAGASIATGPLKFPAEDRADWMAYFQLALQGVSGKANLTSKQKTEAAARIADESLSRQYVHACYMHCAQALVQDPAAKIALNLALSMHGPWGDSFRSALQTTTGGENPQPVQQAWSIADNALLVTGQLDESLWKVYMQCVANQTCESSEG